MVRFELDAEAGRVSEELAKRGVAATSVVHVVVDVSDPGELPMAAIAQAGGAFEWLAEEPELYTEADLLRPR